MAAEPLLPVYLLAGGDRPKIGRALARLRARFGQESAEALSADEASGADAVAACNALGLFAGGGGRLVVVESVERWKAADVEAVAGYLRDPVQGAVLALVAADVAKASRLADACAKVGRVLVYETPRPRDLPEWVRAQFERLGVAADEEAARALVEIAGDDLEALAAEVEKLAAWAGGERVDPAAVESLAVPSHEASAWALTDAWGARDVAAVLRACEAELPRAEAFVIAARLAAQVALVRAAQALAADGLAAREIARRLRVHEFRARNAVAHGERYSREELDDAIVRLAALDAALKGASRLPAELELERALVDVTAGRAPAAAR